MSSEPEKKPGNTSHHAPIPLYAGLLQTLEAAVDREKLGDLFNVVRNAGSFDNLGDANDPDIQRMLARIGVLGAQQTTAAAAKVAESFLRRIAEDVGRSPLHVRVVFRVYSSGLYGLLPEPICGATPRCKACGITKACDYYNAPPKRPPLTAVPPLRRLAADGPDALSDEELLALLLGGSRSTAQHRKVARDLLQRYGSLRELSGVSFGELMSLRDPGEAAAARLTAAFALQGRVLAERRMQGPVVRCGRDFYDLYAGSMRDLKKESFLVVLLDQKNRILREVRVSEGTLTASLVHPREVFAPAIRESAAAVAFIHNHPSGDSAPSREDRDITKRLVATAETVGIRVLDHVIIGEGTYTSFVDDGLL